MAGRGDCRFLIAVMGVVGFLVAAGTGVKGADSVQHDFSPDCTKHMLSLSPCLDFVTGSLSGQPTEDCCSALDNVLAHEPGCLCLLFPIDLTLVVSLPAACNIITSQEICKDIPFTVSADIPFTVSAYVPPKRESNPPNVNARSAKYSDTDSIETLTPIPGPDFFETPIPDTDSFEILVPTSPFGSANAKDNEGELQCQQPNNSLYTFTGNLIIGKQKLPLSPNQILLWALDTLGSTKWRINKRILDVVDRLWAGGGRLADLIDEEDVPIPEKPDTEDET